MTENDFATSGGDDAFTPEEQAAFEAYERGEEAPSAAPAAVEAPEAAPAGGEAAAPAGEPVVDPAAPAIDPQSQARDEKGKFVPHGALHEEREKRKAIEKDRDELREKVARFDERLRIFSEASRAQPAAAAQPAAEPPKVIDPKEDIFGAYEQLKAKLDALEGGVQKSAEDRRVEAEQKAVHDHYIADAQRFVAAEPSFGEAYRHLYQSRGAELLAAGVPESQIVARIRDEEMQIAAAARQANRSPAETIFAIAKARGFAPKAPEPAPATTPTPATPVETAAQKAERVAAGQAGPGKSLSAAGGAPAGEVTFETLMNMSEAEFEAFALKNPDKLDKLMGA